MFGGRSVEHDVSIITGLQACEQLDARHQPVPIYIDRDGRWFTGASLRRIETYRAETLDAEPVVLDLGSRRAALAARGRRGAAARGLFGGGGSDRRRPGPIEHRLDVIIPATHGTQGEDGCLQGALELADIPYAGPTLEAAVLAMNKAVTKRCCAPPGSRCVDDLTLRRSEYEREGADAIIAKIKARFGLPVFAKPASLGSSVGVSRCTTEAELADALQLAFELDRLALVEPAVEGGMEINCAVLGRPGAELRVSVTEQPLATGDVLTFEDKYIPRDGAGKDGGGLKNEGMAAADRMIPAPISDELTERRARAVAADVRGDRLHRRRPRRPAARRRGPAVRQRAQHDPRLVRLLPVGARRAVSFPDLLDELIDIAFAEHAEKQQTTRTFRVQSAGDAGQGPKTS